MAVDARPARQRRNNRLGQKVSCRSDNHSIMGQESKDIALY